MDSVDVKLYTDKRTSRLDYIAGTLLGELLGLKYVVITDRRKIGNTPIINYSEEDISGSFRIIPSGLLAEESINTNAPVVLEAEGNSLLFPSESGDFPFDILAASFWLISRYEEYQPFIPDSHGRFPAEASLAYRHGFLQIPVIEIWTRKLSLELIRHFPFLAFRRQEFSSRVTFDIDQAYAYRGKGMLRGAAGLVSDVMKGGGMERLRSLSGSERDPYDVYDYIFETIDSVKADALFFLPFGSWSEYDRNNPADSRLYRELAGDISARYTTGIHFSYNCGRNHKLAAKEIQRFRKVTGRDPEESRQHYLLVDFPGTYRALEAAAIKTDYSLGYASAPGFRAGISKPFRLYDLQSDRITNLTIAPFAIMDVTLKDYMKLTPAGAKSQIEAVMKEVRNTGGSFVSIWHNSSLTERNGWEGWREVFEFTVKNSII
ncbi:MAG: polysaccharide deacetylase family protein [Bacteroidales bacterium]